MGIPRDPRGSGLPVRSRPWRGVYGTHSGGAAYVFDNSQFRFLLNIHDELFDRIPAAQVLLIYGAGDATGTASSISGVFRGTASLLGRSGNPCAGSHSFTFVRQAGRDAHDIEVRSQ